METHDPNMAQQIAHAVIALQHERTGRAPLSVDVVLSGEILLITIYGALSRTEQALVQSSEDAARFQAFHRQLFTHSADQLRQEIKRVTGVPVREGTVKGETARCAMVQAFTTGTVMLVFRLARCLPAENWSGNRPSGSRFQRSLPMEGRKMPYCISSSTAYDSTAGRVSA